MGIVPEQAAVVEENMYTVGELSKIVKISIDALRYYDEIGLLKPHQVDAKSRYRYYSADQVNELISIMEWKRCGFSLDAIGELLRCGDKGRLKDLYGMKLQQLSAERLGLERSMALLEERLQQLEEESAMRTYQVLIIDDAPFMRQIMQDLIGNQGAVYGFRVAGTAADGAEGIARFKELQPDLTIVDIGLPDMDGDQVVRRLKELQPAAAITMCSARGQLGNVLRSLQSGARQFVVKPFYPELLFKAMQSAVGTEGSADTEALAELLGHERVAAATDTLPQVSILELVTLVMNGADRETLEGWIGRLGESAAGIAP